MKTLFVCTDYSSTGNNAVKFAIQYASSIKCKLVVFHVMRLPKFSPTITEAAFLKLEQKEEGIQKKKLEGLVNKIYHDLQLKKHARRLKVAVKNGIFVTETIVASAKTHKADLVIVGTHGTTGLKLFGSTSSETIFQAESPVMAIPPRYRYKKLKTIVYASDLKNLVNELRCIVPIASSANAEIEILNLKFGFGKTQPIINEKDLMKQAKYKKLKIITQKEGKGGTIIEQLQHYLKSHRPQVLVMFPEERSLFDKLFVRSKTEELINRRTCLPDKTSLAHIS